MRNAVRKIKIQNVMRATLRQLPLTTIPQHSKFAMQPHFVCRLVQNPPEYTVIANTPTLEDMSKETVGF